MCWPGPPGPQGCIESTRSGAYTIKVHLEVDRTLYGQGDKETVRKLLAIVEGLNGKILVPAPDKEPEQLSKGPDAPQKEGAV